MAIDVLAALQDVASAGRGVYTIADAPEAKPADGFHPMIVTIDFSDADDFSDDDRATEVDEAYLTLLPFFNGGPTWILQPRAAGDVWTIECGFDLTEA